MVIFINAQFIATTLILLQLVTGCAQIESLPDDVEEDKTWTRVGPGGGGSTFLPTFSYSDPSNYLLKCDMTGTYMTVDGGQSYELINFPNGASSFAYDPNDRAVIFVGAADLNKSSDHGKTFSRLFPKDDKIHSETFVGDHANYEIETAPNSIYSSSGEEKRIRNIKVDPSNSERIYFSINNYFFTSADNGVSWQKVALDDNIEYIYTNKEDLSKLVYIFTSEGLTIFAKDTRAITLLSFPSEMKPAFSFAAGVGDKSNSSILYGLHNDESLRAHGGIASTSVWSSIDLGKTWFICEDSILTNKNQLLPTYSRLATSENNAETVYVVASSYQEKSGSDSTLHWYGALKSADSGLSWDWVWKGGGGSGTYGVRDGADAANQEDAWVQEAFGGEYIRFIDIGVAPEDPNIAILTDWYRVLKTIDGGKSWQEAYSAVEPGGSFKSRGLDVTTTYGVHFDPHDKDHIAISYTDIGYHHSFDGGESWRRSTNGIPSSWVNTCYWMVFDPEVKDKLWSVWSNLHDFPRGKMTRDPKWNERGKGGVAISTDGGRNWDPSSEGMGHNTPSTSIVLDQNSPVGMRTLYVTVYGEGVFKSVDDGKTWKAQNDGIEGSLAAFEITITPDGVLYLVTSPIPQHRDQTRGKDVFFGKLYRSIDASDSWQELEVGKKVLFPNAVAIDPTNSKKIYLAAWSDISLADLVGSATLKAGENKMFDLEGGIFMSEDGGNIWVSIFDKNEYVYDVTVDPFHPGRLYCNTFSQGAFRSDDEGKTWKELKDYDFHWGHRVIVDQNDPEKVFLTTYGSSVWHGYPVTK